jgi:hypothetical protein
VTIWTILIVSLRMASCTVPWVLLGMSLQRRSWLASIPLVVPLGIAILREILRGSVGPIRLLGQAQSSRLAVLGHAVVESFVALGAGAVWFMFYGLPAFGVIIMVLAASVPIALEAKMAKSSWVLGEVWPRGAGLALENGERIIPLLPGTRVERAGSEFRFIDQGGALALRSGSLGARRVVALLRQHGIQPVVVPRW